ncbi:MAG: hypothetical protein Q9208_004589 [Pyrenodesmia sp. 3 TL-2023]
MVSNSPYNLIQSAPPEWRPQEDRAASAFVGITFFLCLETTFEIFRVFKKHRGLYFWSLFIGVVACFVDNIAILLKFLVAGSTSYWPVYTLLALLGWTCFTICQLLVLYSRLHLVVGSPRIQRCVLYLIIACFCFFNLPTWIVVWPAWNPDETLTKRWSAPNAIVERFTQIGFTLAEVIISGVYFDALFGLLRNKPTVRQKRVFWDLIYVNLATILLDVLVIILVYLNQTGTSHPVQTFSYILKLRLEFAVLNQLMAVAARGLRRDRFGEKRYHDDTIGTSSYFGKDNMEMSQLVDDTKDPREGFEDPGRSESSEGEMEIRVPPRVLEQVRSCSRSGHRSGVDSFLPLQGVRSSGPGPKQSESLGSRARAVGRSLRPASGGGGGDGVASVKARRTRSSTTDDDDGDDEIPLHMWERNGEIVMCIPWLPENNRDGRGRV